MDERELANWWSEYTNDNAPLGLFVYESAARAFLAQYDVTPKEK